MSEEQRQRRARGFLSWIGREIEEHDFRQMLREEERSLKEGLSLADGQQSPLLGANPTNGRPSPKSIFQSPLFANMDPQKLRIPDSNAPVKDDFVLAYTSHLAQGATLRRLFDIGQQNSVEPAPIPLAFNLAKNDELEEENDEEEESLPDQNGQRNKGLKFLSVAVQEIVAEHQSVTYKEVADAILRTSVTQESFRPEHLSEFAREEQNIKRRVYDALNVLIAAGVLIKEGKRVRKNEINKKTKVDIKRVEINSLRTRLVGLLET